MEQHCELSNTPVYEFHSQSRRRKSEFLSKCFYSLSRVKGIGAVEEVNNGLVMRMSGRRRVYKGLISDEIKAL